MADHAVLLTLAYDGTAFAGWQKQPGQRTVQQTLERAIESMDGAPVQTWGASRTDAGVHAIAQRVSFDPARDIPTYGWVRGLNGQLPDDVAVSAAESVVRGYDPRFDSAGKHYRYLIQRSASRDPLMHNRAWHVRHRLDTAAMRETAAELLGRHDFRAFQGPNDYRDNTVRTLTRVDVIEGWAGDPTLYAIEVEGTAFLKNMVRIIAGTLADAGRHRFDARRVRELLAPGGPRRGAGPTAPARGLTLVSVTLNYQPRFKRVGSRRIPALSEEGSKKEP